MFPYKSRWKWWLRPRQRHLVDALEQRPGAFESPDGQELERRVHALEVWLKVRVALLVLLSFSIIASVTTMVLEAIGGPEQATALVQTIKGIASTGAGIFSLLYFFTLRTLGQLEIDALLLLPAHRVH